MVTKEIAQFYQNNETLTYVSSTVVKIGVRRLTPDAFKKRVAIDALEIMKFLSPGSREDFLNGTYSSDKAFEALTSLAYGKIKEEASKLMDTSVDASYNFAGHRLVVDVRTNEEILFDSTQRACPDANVETWTNWLNRIDKKVKAEIMGMTTIGLIEYDPYNINLKEEAVFNGQQVVRYNAHRTPDWRETEIIDPVLPPLFKEFMTFFLPDLASKQYVLNWLHFMLVDRNECHLLLHGRKGVGKNTLTSICEKLVGVENFKVIDPKFWDSRFNGELKYKRLCFFDEHDITTENINQFKAYANPSISIEEKGVKVERDYKNFASFIIANNNPNGNFLETDDRRFSVPVISTERLDRAWERDKIIKLYDSIENDDSFIANIGWWLIKEGGKFGYDALTPLKTNLFYELVENSMPQWQVKLITALRSGEYVDGIEMDDLSIILDMANPPGHVKVTRFLDNTTDKEGDYYGRISRKKGEGRKILPHAKYNTINLDF